MAQGGPGLADGGSAGPPPAPASDQVPARGSLAEDARALAVRLGLQRGASRTVQRHLVRAARRFTVLVAADLLAFELLRLLLRALRNEALIGSTVAEVLQDRLPQGYMGGWQFAAALVVGLYVTGNYRTGDARRDPVRLFFGCALAVALPLWMALWTDGLGLVLFQYVVTVSLLWAGIVTERLAMDRVVARIFRESRRAAPTLFVGDAEACRAAAAMPVFRSGDEHWVVGFVDKQAPPAPDAVGSLAEFPRVLHETRAETVVICGYLSDPDLHEVAGAALSAGCQLLSLPRSISIVGVQPSVVWRKGQPLVELTTPSLRGQQLVLKRMLDLGAGTLMLLLAGPLMLGIALAIRLDSGGPVFFRQERVGTGGRKFRVWKFRTMHHGASEEAHRKLVTDMLKGRKGPAPADEGQVYKLVNDPRVTRVGSWLRRTSLDELPQLFNVLRGEMSLVGPRPPLPYECEAYDQWQFDRLQVRPGITGLWQVSGRNRLTYNQMIEMDLQYVRNWSLYLDFKILLRTIPEVLFNRGKAA